MAEERKRFGFFGNAGAADSDTNLAGNAASTESAPGLRKLKDKREANVLEEDRKSAFYSMGINASFEALPVDLAVVDNNEHPRAWATWQDGG